MAGLGSPGTNTGITGLLSSFGLGTGGSSNGGYFPTTSLGTKPGTAALAVGSRPAQATPAGAIPSMYNPSGGSASGNTGNSVAPPGSPGNPLPPPGGQSAVQNVQANPYMQSSLNRLNSLSDYAKTQADTNFRDTDMAKWRANQSVMNNELMQRAGQAGGLGLTNSALATLKMRQNEGATQAAEDFRRQNEANRQGWFGQAVGAAGQGANVAGGIASNQLGQGQLQNDIFKANADYQIAQAKLPIELQAAQSQGFASAMQGLAALKGLL